MPSKTFAEYTIPTEAVMLPGGSSFEVQGIGLPALTHLIQFHLADIVKAYTLYQQGKHGAMSKSMLAELAMIVARDMPTLTMEIISAGMVEENVDMAKLRRMPFPAQINAMLLIVKLSSQEAGGLKNLSAFVAPLFSDVVNSAGVEPGTLKGKLLASIMGAAGMSVSSSPAAMPTPTDTP